MSILSNIFKIYGIKVFFDSIVSKYQCGFRRGYNVQRWLITLIEKWKKNVDNGEALVRYSLIFQKHLIVYLMNFELLNWKHVVLAKTI